MLKAVSNLLQYLVDYIKRDGTTPLTGNWDAGNFYIRAKNFLYQSEIDDGNSGTADTIDWTAGPLHKSTLTGNVTYTFTAPEAPCFLQIKVVQGSGPYTITWPTIKWAGGVTPILSQTNGATDIYTFYYDGAVYWQKGVQFALA